MFRVNLTALEGPTGQAAIVAKGAIFLTDDNKIKIRPKTPDDAHVLRGVALDPITYIDDKDEDVTIDQKTDPVNWIKNLYRQYKSYALIASTAKEISVKVQEAFKGSPSEVLSKYIVQQRKSLKKQAQMITKMKLGGSTLSSLKELREKIERFNKRNTIIANLKKQLSISDSLSNTFKPVNYENIAFELGGFAQKGEDGPKGEVKAHTRTLDSGKVVHVDQHTRKYKHLSKEEKDHLNIDKYIRRNSAFDDDTKKWIHKYTGAGYDTLNRALRQSKFGDEPEQVKTFMNAMDKVVASGVVQENITLYRGVGSKFAETITSLQEGQIFFDRGFISTSLYPSGAFSSEIRMNIKVPKGANAMYVGDISSHSGEHEVLLPRGSAFKAKKLKNQYGKTVIEAEYLGVSHEHIKMSEAVQSKKRRRHSKKFVWKLEDVEFLPPGTDFTPQPLKKESIADQIKEASTQVKGHLRRSKKGIVAQVDQHTREIQDISDWKTGGSPGGTQGAKWIVDSDGVRYVMKGMDYVDKDRVGIEVLAANVYRHLGIDSPSVKLATYKGKLVSISKELLGAKARSSIMGDSALSNGFMADVFTANWDVVGLDYDNILYKGTTPYRMDFGGTFTYRAMGGKKAYPSIPSEHKTLLDLNYNRQSSRAFGSISLTDMRKHAAAIGRLSDDWITGAVAKARLSPNTAKEVISGMKGRRDWMKDFSSGKILEAIVIEASTTVKGYTKKSKKGIAFSVKQHKRELLRQKMAVESVIATKERAWEWDPVELQKKMSKQRTGALGENIVAEILIKDGKKDVRFLSHGKEKAFDVRSGLAKSRNTLYEVKAGLASVKEKSQRWRLSIGNSNGKKERAWKKTATPEQLRAWTVDKENKIFQAKKDMIRDVYKETGYKPKVRTITGIVNTDKRIMDVYIFKGLHKRIGWRSPLAQKRYAYSVKYKRKKK